MYNLRNNSLSQNRLNDLMYVHYNLRLRELQVRRANSSISLDNALLEHLLKDWIVDAGRTDFPENEVFHAYILMILQSDIITHFQLDACRKSKESFIYCLNQFLFFFFCRKFYIVKWNRLMHMRMT